MPQIQIYLAIILPLITPLIGSSAAAMLSQRHWPAAANDAIAWVILLGCAALSVWLNNQFVGSPSAIIDAIIAAATLLVSGPLTKLGPWLVWLDWLQSHAGILLPLVKSTPVNANPVRIPTRPSAITFPPPQA